MDIETQAAVDLQDLSGSLFIFIFIFPAQPLSPLSSWQHPELRRATPRQTFSDLDSDLRGRTQSPGSASRQGTVTERDMWPSPSGEIQTWTLAKPGEKEV